jgi:hypothetical protein
MPAWYITISTPLGDKHKTIRGTEMKTKEDAIAECVKLQNARGWKSGLPMAPAGEITDCVPAKWPDHFRGRPAALDAAYPSPLSRADLLK